MDHELVNLTDDSPPASPKTPTASVVRTSVGPNSSGPAVMQNQHQPSPEQQPHQPLPKRLRASSEPTMDTENHNNQSPPAQLRLVRSSSENVITRSEKQPIFNNYRLQGTMFKDQLTEAEHHELLMRQQECSNPKRPVDCMSRADGTGSSSLIPELSPPAMIGPAGAHDIPSVGSSSSSKKPLNVVSQVPPGTSLLNMLLESPAHKQNSQLPTSLATPPPISSPPVSSPPTQALLASASVQSASLASSLVSTHPTSSAAHVPAASLVPLAPPVPDPHMSAQSMPSSLASAPHPLLIAPPIPTPIVSMPPMPAHIASAPPVLAPPVMTLPVRAPLLSTPLVPLTSFPPIMAPLVSAPAALAPLLLTASERHIPDTLRLFPVEIPFLFPMKRERGSSSRADTDVDLSVYRDDSLIRPGEMDWVVAMPAANPIVEYEQDDVAVVPHNGGGHRRNVVQDVNLDLSL